MSLIYTYIYIEVLLIFEMTTLNYSNLLNLGVDMFRMKSKGLLMTALLLVANPVSAQDEKMVIKLDVIEKIHAQEKGGDELYFSITEFPSKGRPSHYQIPEFPSHWLSEHLKGVQNVILWEKASKECEPVKVIISLVEEDLPPWNIDDLLGSIELNVKCENGKLATQWNIPNKENTAVIGNVNNAFSFSGKNAEYHAIFSFEKRALTASEQKQADEIESEKNNRIQADHIYLPI